MFRAEKPSPKPSPLRGDMMEEEVPTIKIALYKLKPKTPAATSSRAKPNAINKNGLTKVQQSFVDRLDKMRNEAKEKKKKEFAHLRKNN